MKSYIFPLLILLFGSTAFSASPNLSEGGIGGLAIFDTIKDRPIIRALEYNNYINADKLRPGDLILEIDKIPVHQKSYSEVLKLVLGKVGTPMSLKVLRYNGIEHYYEINRIRVTQSMNPTWWQIPDYKYISFEQGIEVALDQIPKQCANVLDTAKYYGSENIYFSKFLVKEAYEALYIKDANDKYYWQCNFLQTEDKNLAEGMYKTLAYKLSTFSIPQTKINKVYNNSDSKNEILITTKETFNPKYYNAKVMAIMEKVYNQAEQKDLWVVRLEVRN
ncbi:MAG: hypothetical protein H6553_13050 [Chitinophagales bacterium]|nr:hypothetical protein [Chitinophagales bacterium]